MKRPCEGSESSNLLERVTDMQQRAPSGEEVAVAMPVGLGEGVAAVFVLENGQKRAPAARRSKTGKKSFGC